MKKELTDFEVERALRESLGEERTAVVAFLLHLGEFEQRRLYEKSGHPTVWEYLRQTRAKTILGHSVVDGEYEAVLSRALDALLERHEKRSTPSAKPRTVKSPKAGSRHIPIEVERAVRQRDGNRCAWRVGEGPACGSTHRLQLDHIRSFALGGESSVENVRLLCRNHNQQHAREVFGADSIERAIAKRRLRHGRCRIRRIGIS